MSLTQPSFCSLGFRRECFRALSTTLKKGDFLAAVLNGLRMLEPDCTYSRAQNMSTHKLITVVFCRMTDVILCSLFSYILSLESISTSLENLGHKYFQCCVYCKEIVDSPLPVCILCFLVEDVIFLLIQLPTDQPLPAIMNSAS